RHTSASAVLPSQRRIVTRKLAGEKRQDQLRFTFRLERVRQNRAERRLDLGQNLPRRDRPWHRGAGGLQRSGVKGAFMFRVGIACALLLLAASHAAIAQSKIERGFYLLFSFKACAIAPPPGGADGKPFAYRALAGGGLTLSTPAFTVTASNI